MIEVSADSKVTDINETEREEHCLPGHINGVWRKMYDLMNA